MYKNLGTLPWYLILSIFIPYHYYQSQKKCYLMQSQIRFHAFLHGCVSAYVTKSRKSQVFLEDILCSGFKEVYLF